MILDFREGRFLQAKSWGRGRWLFQVRVARLMVLVAVAAVLCVAWIYHREYATTERSWASMHLRDLHHDESIQRRWAAENLDRAEADDVARVVSGLAVPRPCGAWPTSARRPRLTRLRSKRPLKTIPRSRFGMPRWVHCSRDGPSTRTMRMCWAAEGRNRKGRATQHGISPCSMQLPAE
jgi:hypothetical protein